jgi:hypothetical protein
LCMRCITPVISATFSLNLGPPNAASLFVQGELITASPKIV